MDRNTITSLEIEWKLSSTATWKWSILTFQVFENGKAWPPAGAIACNDSFVVMYEGLGHKCTHLLPLITGGFIQRGSFQNKKFTRILRKKSIEYFLGCLILTLFK